MDTLVLKGLEKLKEVKVAKKVIYTIKDAKLGLVAFPDYFEVDIAALTGSADDPIKITMFETLEDYQAAVRPIIVAEALKKLTAEEIDALRVAFEKGELEHVGTSAPPEGIVVGQGETLTPLT
jgi:hypothetical protein